MNALEKLESIAAEVVQLAPTDQCALAQLETQFRDLERLLEHEHPLAAELSSRSASWLSIQADDLESDTASTISNVVTSLQQALDVAPRDSLQAESLLRDALKQLESAGSSSSNRGTEADRDTSCPESDDAVGSGLILAAPDPELLAGFLTEAQEHLEAADVQLLAIEREPTNQESVGAVFRAFHTIKGVAGFLGLADINRLSHEAESLLEKARRMELTLTGPSLETVFATVNVLKQLVAGLAADEPRSAHKPLVDQTIALLRSTAVAPAASVAAPPNATPVEAVVETAIPRSRSLTAELLRVDCARLDKLVDMIGELVIAESMVHRHLGELGTEAARQAVQLNKITRNLQQLSLSLRMVPVRGTFQKMARLVRDVAKKLDKPVHVQMFGEDTELDKTVVDQIGDPLVHMIRNSVDHGIESPSERLANGKPAHGTITLRAFHRGGNICIEIEDDGRGLDPQKILAKAREKGLVPPDAQLTEAETLDLIFTPGFSTADRLTDLSGRGVGMDVVRRNVEALRGSVELRSTLGQGTCFLLRLPLTLAIIDGMVVRVGRQRFIIPTLSIIELIRPATGDVRTVCERGEFLTVRDQQVVMLRSGELLQQEDSPLPVENGIVVLVEAAGTTAGLLVDEVLGQQQAVIKKLGGRLDAQPGLSGGAIMPDGTVGLILDIQGLLQLQQSQT